MAHSTGAVPLFLQHRGTACLPLTRTLPLRVHLSEEVRKGELKLSEREEENGGWRGRSRVKGLACLQGKRQKKEVRRNEKTHSSAVVYEYVAALVCMSEQWGEAWGNDTHMISV